ncbi:MerR family transcriptional regulator [Nocardia thailandica]|uniref:MerR family transcriptional regulator n=1 Tax=Nocardia thailandica TaxID=257275 RepID=A0ABW6PXM0_9NOCA
MGAGAMRIGELAGLAEVSTRTVDYYTGLGLLTPLARTAGNFRLYDPADASRIRLIRSLEAQGIPLEEIARAFSQRPGDLGAALDQLDDALRTLHAAADAAPEAMRGVLAVITTRIQTLITIALHLPPDLPVL